jgi:hypothetical protein
MYECLREELCFRNRLVCEHSSKDPFPLRVAASAVNAQERHVISDDSDLVIVREVKRDVLSGSSC